MNQKITARIIKPQGVEHDLSADMVVMPGSEGEFGVLYGHIPIVAQLNDGEVKVHNGNDIKIFPINKGVAIVNNTSVDIVCSL